MNSTEGEDQSNPYRAPSAIDDAPRISTPLFGRWLNFRKLNIVAKGLAYGVLAVMSSILAAAIVIGVIRVLGYRESTTVNVQILIAFATIGCITALVTFPVYVYFMCRKLNRDQHH